MFFKEIFLYADQLLSFFGSAVILYTSLRAVYLFCWGVRTGTLDINLIRLELGYGIILGLEFMIGSDIIKSMARPNYYDLGMLAALVFIRTFLSYFLGRELAELSPSRKKSTP